MHTVDTSREYNLKNLNTHTVWHTWENLFIVILLQYKYEKIRTSSESWEYVLKYMHEDHRQIIEL